MNFFSRLNRVHRNGSEIQRAHHEIKAEEQLFQSNIHSFKALVLTFSTICQDNLFVGMNHIVIEVFPTTLLSKN